jgi:DNA-binding CsgD family transcriptional regulator
MKPRIFDEDWVENHKKQVRKLSELGCTDAEIAYILGCSKSTVHNYFQEDINEGKSHVRAQLRKAQLELAINEKNPTMLIWLGKQLLGQKEPKNQTEHSGAVKFEKVIFTDDDKNRKNT